MLCSFIYWLLMIGAELFSLLALPLTPRRQSQ